MNLKVHRERPAKNVVTKLQETGKKKMHEPINLPCRKSGDREQYRVSKGKSFLHGLLPFQNVTGNTDKF